MGQAVNHVYPADKTSDDVPIWEGGHRIHHVRVMKFALAFDLLNQLRGRLLACRVDPKWALVLAGPLPSFEPLEAHDQETGPRLVHRQTHACIIRVLKEIFVDLESFIFLSSLF